MKNIYKVEPLKFTIINELPNAWSDQIYKELLEIMDYGDTSDLNNTELKRNVFIITF